MSAVRNHQHIVWCPKYRRAVLVGPIVQALEVILTAKCSELGAEVTALNVQPDHVHVVVQVPAALALSVLVQHLKGASSFVLRRQFPALREVCDGSLWARRYFSVSTGTNALRAVRQYVENQ